jgi:acyl-CoA oxidase
MKDPNIVSVASSGFSAFDHGLSIKHGVHVFLYMKTIFNLGTERHDRYVRAAAELKDIGCFGLTEFAHGSNVRGIQTEAHYDHRKREFVINSPTKEAMKFWIGAAAEVANMSVIWAQLYIDGKCYGVHAYIVPIRDTKTHQLLPGVLIGDCGPKNGCNGIDNGFILLDNVRVPVENQLDRISGVNEEGKFFTHVEGEEKRFGIQLGALSGGRFMVAMTSGVMTLSALTIAIRYACIRRQFNSGSGLPENLLIEYPLTKRRMMPLLAQAIVYQMGNFEMIGEMDKNYKNILNPKNTVMQELHGISSSLKPKSGWLATETIRECRLMCGGHGYSYFSKLGVLYNDNDIQNTWEGDNHVLLQQATKYVLDNAQKVMKGKDITSPTLQFLKDVHFSAYLASKC